jgi:hypothetical protein
LHIASCENIFRHNFLWENLIAVTGLMVTVAIDCKRTHLPTEMLCTVYCCLHVNAVISEENISRIRENGNYTSETELKIKKITENNLLEYFVCIIFSELQILERVSVGIFILHMKKT